MTLKAPTKVKRGLARSGKPLAVTVAATVVDTARKLSTASDSAVLPRR